MRRYTIPITLFVLTLLLAAWTNGTFNAYYWSKGAIMGLWFSVIVFISMIICFPEDHWHK